MASPAPRLRSKVPSDLASLQKLHERTGWTPGAAHVRPDPATRAQKELLIANLEQMWACHADWVFSQIFGTATRRDASGRRTAERPAHGCMVFAPQPFPYAVPEGVQHYVLWCAAPRREVSDRDITERISREVEAHGGGDFVWYENPKMSVEHEALYHVQDATLAAHQALAC